MQVAENNHLKETKSTAVLIRVHDVELFPETMTLSWQISEPNEAVIKELFDRRLDLLGGADENLLKLHTFRILSTAKIGKFKFCAFWQARIQYLQDFFLIDQNLLVNKNQFLFFYGKFAFWRVGDEWKAKIC